MTLSDYFVFCFKIQQDQLVLSLYWMKESVYILLFFSLLLFSNVTSPDFLLKKSCSLEKLHLFSAHVSDDIHVLFQHRMRPEIAQLLTPHIYQDLENHPSVLRYEKIKVSLPYLILCCCQQLQSLYFP